MILDTNAISAAADGHPGVVKILTVAQHLALPVVAIGEFRYGIAQSRHQAHYSRWLTTLISDSNVLDITEQTTFHYATIQTELRKSGTPIPSNDLWIAALSRQHDLPILSRDHHFDKVSGIRRFGW